jgi:hypothetical protein
MIASLYKCQSRQDERKKKKMKADFYKHHLNACLQSNRTSRDLNIDKEYKNFYIVFWEVITRRISI